MKRIIWLLLVLLVVGLQATTQSEVITMDGNDLLTNCNQAIKGFDKIGNPTMQQFGDGMFCIGYIAGFTAAHNLTSLKMGNKPVFCLPRDRTIRNSQAIRIVVKYLKDHPESFTTPQGISVALALQEAFPCPPLK